eukprot:4318168-Prymnesium_polylepis.1
MEASAVSVSKLKRGHVRESTDARNVRVPRGRPQNVIVPVLERVAVRLHLPRRHEQCFDRVAHVQQRLFDVLGGAVVDAAYDYIDASRLHRRERCLDIFHRLRHVDCFDGVVGHHTILLCDRRAGGADSAREDGIFLKEARREVAEHAELFSLGRDHLDGILEVLIRRR